jgi:hypothetical protein
MPANFARDVWIDLAGAAAIAGAGALAFYLFADNLSFPVRIVTAALLVLSLTSSPAIAA